MTVMGIVDDVAAVLGAPDLAGLRTLVERTPRLFGSDVGDALGRVAVNARADGEAEVADHAVVVAALLRRCLLVGTAEAFAEVVGRSTGVEEAWVAAIAARGAGRTDAAEAAWRRLLALLPDDARRPVPLGRLDALSALGTMLLDRYRTGDGARYLDDAVRLLSSAVAEAEPDARADHENNLGAAAMARYDLRNDPADVAIAVTAFTAAADDTHASPAARTFGRSGLGGALLARFEVAGERADLDAAIAHLEAARDGSGPRPDGEVSNNLGLALLSRHTNAGAPADLRRAEAALREAVTFWPTDSAEWPGATANLAQALLQSYESDSDSAALDEAVTLAERAVTSPVSRTVDLPGYRNTLGACLMASFGRSGELDELDRAIDTFRLAADGADPGAPEQALYLDGLAGSLLDRFVRRGAPADIRAAVEAAESAVRATGPAESERPRRLATLANCLASDPASAASAPVVERIVACYSAALRSTPLGSPDRWLYATGHASGLLDRYALHRDPHDLDDAVHGYRTALAQAPAGASGLAALHYNLAGALDLRHERDGHARDRRAALRELRRTGHIAAERSPDVALLAGRDLGDRLARRGRWSQAATAYATALSAMRRLVQVQAVRADRETRLREAGRLTANATLSAVRSGRRDDAAALLDQGRATLLALVLDRERADLSYLRDRGRVDLADRYRRAAVRVSLLEVGTGLPAGLR